MNEFFPLASAAGMTVGLAVCALIVGLALAMFFAVWESAKWRPVAWAGSALVSILRGLHYQSWVRADPSADGH